MFIKNIQPPDATNLAIIIIIIIIIYKWFSREAWWHIGMYVMELNVSKTLASLSLLSIWVDRVQ